MVPPLVKLALDYYRAPLAYGHLSDVSRPLPPGFTKLLTEFGAALSGPRIEETAAALSTDADELQEAARFFARHALLSPAGDYYRYLGLPRNASAEAVRVHYQLLIRMFHPDRLANASEADLAYSSRLNAAYRVLRDPEARARYDEQLPALSSRPRRGDLAAFFQPRQPELGVERPRLRQRVGNLLRRPVVAVPMAGVLMVGVALLVMRWQTSPDLRVLTPAEEVQERPLPRYLQRGAEPKDGAVVVSQAAGSERAVEKPVEGAASVCRLARRVASRIRQRVGVRRHRLRCPLRMPRMPRIGNGAGVCRAARGGGCGGASGRAAGGASAGRTLCIGDGGWRCGGGGATRGGAAQGGRS